jgi:threonine/homoserine/homoserine lactone efflux protein
MTFLFFLKGLAIGLSISAPIGPMGLLCIRRTLASGRTCGIVTGLGVATADACYSSIAAFGLAMLSNVLMAHGTLPRLAGGLVLCLLGARIFFEKARPVLASEGLPAIRLLAAYATALFLALSNPVGIAIFTAIFAGTGLADTGGDYLGAGLLVAGVASGSLSWWIILSTSVSLIGKRLSPRMLSAVNRISGALIVVFGVLVLFHLGG